MTNLRESLRQIAQRDLSWAFAAVWLFFLGYPLVSLLTSDRSTLAVVYGVALLVAFAAIYVCASFQMMAWRDKARRRPVAGIYLAALVAVAAATVPVLGDQCLTFAPYLMAISVFGLSGSLGLVFVIVVLAFVVIAPEVIPGWELDPGTTLTFVVVALVMAGANALVGKERERERAEQRRREADEQLAVVAERERVARDVHDILGHTLTVMTIKTELAQRLVDLDPERAKGELAELHAMSREALAEVRSTVGQLRTPDLRTELASACTALSAAQIEADVPHDVGDLPAPRRAVFAWVVRESVTNVVRHSGAARCTITVDPDRIEILDDGRGIPAQAFGNGLRGLTERVEGAGGALSVSPAAPGTRVAVTF